MGKKKFLKVGDPHATVSNLDEMRLLMAHVLKIATSTKVDYVVLYGDLFHTHAWIRMEVMEAWWEMLSQFAAANIEVIIIEGNHDQPGSKELEGKMSAVTFLERMFHDRGGGKIRVISRPEVIEGIGFVPYTHSAERFYQWASDLFRLGAADTLCCHATFEGSTFDNGFYAPGGFDLSRVPQNHVVSGHIHSYQEFGKAWYIGSPKWETAIDADMDKGVWLVNAENGKLDRENAKFISTAGVVTPMRKIVLTETDELPELDSRSKYLIELVGPSSWITKTKKKYMGRASIKTTYTDAKLRSQRESRPEGTIDEFLDKDFQTSAGVDKKRLTEYIKGA